jgi:hypothetical protein
MVYMKQAQAVFLPEVLVFLDLNHVGFILESLLLEEEEEEEEEEAQQRCFYTPEARFQPLN